MYFPAIIYETIKNTFTFLSTKTPSYPLIHNFKTFFESVMTQPTFPTKCVWTHRPKYRHLLFSAYNQRMAPADTITNFLLIGNTKPDDLRFFYHVSYWYMIYIILRYDTMVSAAYHILIQNSVSHLHSKL